MDPVDGPGLPGACGRANRVGVPARVLASTAFNDDPVPLSIAGIRESHAELFRSLEASDDFIEAHAVFVDYQSNAFGLRKADPHSRTSTGTAARHEWRSSWRKVLQGWGMDSNGAAGAVLKGWVASRFGLVPSFHKVPLAGVASPAWTIYANERAASRLNGNEIDQQLDLLYEFCQWSLHRSRAGGRMPQSRHLRLWRGSNNCEEQIISGSLKDRRCTVRLNNIVSFSQSQEDASCFGDWVFEVMVPACKVVVFPEMLPGQVLQGEQEVLAIGGHYDVLARYA